MRAIELMHEKLGKHSTLLLQLSIQCLMITMLGNSGRQDVDCSERYDENT